MTWKWKKNDSLNLILIKFKQNDHKLMKFLLYFILCIPPSRFPPFILVWWYSSFSTLKYVLCLHNTLFNFHPIHMGADPDLRMTGSGIDPGERIRIRIRTENSPYYFFYFVINNFGDPYFKLLFEGGKTNFLDFFS